MQSQRPATQGFEIPSLYQRYVYPQGEKACITRVVYKTKHNKEMKVIFLI